MVSLVIWFIINITLGNIIINMILMDPVINIAIVIFLTISIEWIFIRHAKSNMMFVKEVFPSLIYILIYIILNKYSYIQIVEYTQYIWLVIGFFFLFYSDKKDKIRSTKVKLKLDSTCNDIIDSYITDYINSLPIDIVKSRWPTDRVTQDSKYRIIEIDVSYDLMRAGITNTVCKETLKKYTYKRMDNIFVPELSVVVGLKDV